MLLIFYTDTHIDFYTKSKRWKIYFYIDSKLLFKAIFVSVVRGGNKLCLQARAGVEPTKGPWVSGTWVFWETHSVWPAWWPSSNPARAGLIVMFCAWHMHTPGIQWLDIFWGKLELYMPPPRGGAYRFALVCPSIWMSVRQSVIKSLCCEELTKKKC